MLADWREKVEAKIVPKSIDKYARSNRRLRLTGHGTNSGYPETFGIQKFLRSTHLPILFQSVALWFDIKGSRKVNLVRARL